MPKDDFEKFAARFEKTFGVDTLEVASKDADKPYEVISTGSLDLDLATGVGGLVEGRLVEVWGPDAVGKTTLCLMMIAEAQKKHPTKRTAWIDMEQTFDKPWARAHDVDLDRLMIFTPESSEDVADAIKDMVRSGLFSIVALDSIGAMIPEAAKEKDADEAIVGTQAKVVTRMVQIAAVECNKSQTTVVMINQQRANIGSYGADTTTSGGHCLKYCTTMKMKLSRTGDTPYTVQVNGVKVTVGFKIKVRLERNKVAPPFVDAEIVLFNQPSKFGPIGIDKIDEAVTVGIRTKVIEQGGAWYTLPDGERYQGRDAVVEAVRKNPALVDLIRDKVLDTVADLVVEHDIEEDLAELREPPQMNESMKAKLTAKAGSKSAVA